MWWKEYWATPSSTRDPDSNCKAGNYPRDKREVTHSAHRCSLTRTMIMVKWQNQTTEKWIKRADIVFTLAICSSTIQCLMDSTMLWKYKTKINSTTRNWQLTQRQEGHCVMFWLTQVVSFKFSIFCKMEKKKKTGCKNSNFKSRRAFFVLWTSTKQVPIWNRLVKS